MHGLVGGEKPPNAILRSGGISACGWCGHCGGIVNLLDSGASFLCVHTRQSSGEPIDKHKPTTWEVQSYYSRYF